MASDYAKVFVIPGPQVQSTENPAGNVLALLKN
jgi:hypothetical protein